MSQQYMAHTCYRVKNLDESLAFYTQAFDFTVSRLRDFPEHRFTLAYLTLPNSDYELELTYNYHHDGYNIGDGYGHIAIGVDNLEALHQQHVEKGYNVTPLKGLPNTPPSYYFIIDPDGYKIEVIRSRK